MAIKINYKLFLVALYCLFFAIFLCSVSPLAEDKNKISKRTYQSEMEKNKKFANGARLPEIRLKGNKDSENLKPIEEMEGYADADHLSEVNAKVLAEELLTYDQFLQKYTEFGFDPSIDADRMLWVRKVEYPKGVYYMRGFVNNAVVTYCYDAETGRNLGYHIISLDKDGFKNIDPPYHAEQK